MDEEEVFDFFQKRINMLDALVITGGEPTLYGQALIAFCHRFKQLFPNKLLKVDTNGSHPEMIQALSEIADFCAMDFKSDDYSSFSTIDLSTINRSLQQIIKFRDFEIRVTLFPEYVDQKSLKKILDMVKFNAIKKITLQQYRPLEKNEKTYSKEEIEGWFRAMQEKEIAVLYRGF